jgi:hypothetical protein
MTLDGCEIISIWSLIDESINQVGSLMLAIIYEKMRCHRKILCVRDLIRGSFCGKDPDRDPLFGKVLLQRNIMTPLVFYRFSIVCLMNKPALYPNYNKRMTPILLHF